MDDALLEAHVSHLRSTNLNLASYQPAFQPLRIPDSTLHGTLEHIACRNTPDLVK